MRTGKLSKTVIEGRNKKEVKQQEIGAQL